MKRNKAGGPDEVVTEILRTLDNLHIDKVTKVIDKIYDSGKIAGELCRSIFINASGMNKFKFYKTIKWISCVIKPITKILTNLGLIQNYTKNRAKNNIALFQPLEQEM